MEHQTKNSSFCGCAFMRSWKQAVPWLKTEPSGTGTVQHGNFGKCSLIPSNTLQKKITMKLSIRTVYLFWRDYKISTGLSVTVAQWGPQRLSQFQLCDPWGLSQCKLCDPRGLSQCQLWDRLFSGETYPLCSTINRIYITAQSNTNFY
jgi:hypothetical protein